MMILIMYIMKTMSFLLALSMGSALIGLTAVVFGRTVVAVDLKDIAINNPFRVVDDCSISQFRGVFWTQKQSYGTSLLKFPQSSTIVLNDDRMWTYASWLVTLCFRFIDIRYTFDFNHDHSHAVISMECFHVRISPLILRNTMTLVIGNHPSSEEGSNPMYQESIVWQRNTTLFGIPFSSGIYKLVQVIDGNGKRLPAFDLYLEYMKSIKSDQIYMLVHR